MCCCRVNTNILMANLFAKYDKPTGLSYNQIERFYNYMFENFYVYMPSDFCLEKIKECVREYTQLYTINKDGESIIVKRGELKPNLEYFNSIYSEANSKYIERLTSSFIETI